MAALFGVVEKCKSSQTKPVPSSANEFLPFTRHLKTSEDIGCAPRKYLFWMRSRHSPWFGRDYAALRHRRCSSVYINWFRGPLPPPAPPLHTLVLSRSLFLHPVPLLLGFPFLFSCQSPQTSLSCPSLIFHGRGNFSLPGKNSLAGVKMCVYHCSTELLAPPRPCDGDCAEHRLFAAS